MAYGRPGATFWDVQEAAKGAFAKEFIDNTPQGFNTPVLIGASSFPAVTPAAGHREGASQKPSLTSMRPPPPWIPRACIGCRKALNGLIGHRTTLVIAHRLSTVKRTPRILVINKGRIPKQGKHCRSSGPSGFTRNSVNTQISGRPEAPPRTRNEGDRHETGGFFGPGRHLDHDERYLSDPKKVKYFLGAAEALRPGKMSLLVVVTNQSGVARGDFSQNTP